MLFCFSRASLWSVPSSIFQRYWESKCSTDLSLEYFIPFQVNVSDEFAKNTFLLKLAVFLLHFDSLWCSMTWEPQVQLLLLWVSNWLGLKSAPSYVLTCYTFKYQYTVSKLYSIPFLRFWQREFVEQSRASSVGDHFIYSCDLNVWFRGDIVRRN